MSLPTLFPLVLLLCYLGAAAVYAWHGDWRRTVSRAASSVYIAAVTIQRLGGAGVTELPDRTLDPPGES